MTDSLVGDQAPGQPEGVAIDGTGARLIAGDAGSTAWRVAYADGSVVPESIPADMMTVDAAVEIGAHPSPNRAQQIVCRNRRRPSSPDN